eukprot:GHVP01040731.1.p1 GENE.GHVP01040731.1~~GHVP01040731.1.p1  ORF type:complete len:148 (+),score=14.52 GHVP01040731.1:158-601(+)
MYFTIFDREGYVVAEYTNPPGINIESEDNNKSLKEPVILFGAQDMINDTTTNISVDYVFDYYISGFVNSIGFKAIILHKDKRVHLKNLFKEIDRCITSSILNPFYKLHKKRDGVADSINDTTSNSINDNMRNRIDITKIRALLQSIY